MSQTNTKNISIAIVLIGIILCCPCFLFAQKTKSQIEREKRKNLNRIAQTEKILSQTYKKKQATIGQLQALQNKIKIQKSLIASLKEELKILNSEMSDISLLINALNHDLTQLRQEYASMVYETYKTNKTYHVLMYLFASQSLNDFFMKIKYFEQYTKSRKDQVQQIEAVFQELVTQKNELQIRRDEQSSILSAQIRQQNNLNLSERKRRDLILQLTSKEKKLREEVVKRKNAIAELDKMMEKILREEATRSTVNTVDNVNFENYKYKLDWPVTSGFISSKFGRQPHPVLNNIFVQNSGVNIQTKINETVRVVSSGVVTTVALIPGMQKVVIVRHGKYLTVYGRLKSIKVKKGDKVVKNDILGTVFTDSDGLTQLEFQVWAGNKKLNPENWLAKK